MKAKGFTRKSLTAGEIEETVKNIFDKFSWKDLRVALEHNYGRRLMEWRLPSECEAT